MTLRWRQDVIGSGSPWFKVDGLGPSDVEVSCCVCVFACAREREREEHVWTSGCVCVTEREKRGTRVAITMCESVCVCV